MADGTSPLTMEAADLPEGGAIVFALAGQRYALPIEAIEAIAAPPALCRIPHAAPGLIGAGNLGGQVVPIIDLGVLLGNAARDYDGTGEVLRVRAVAGSVGLWVARTESLLPAGATIDASVKSLEPEALARLGMIAPSLAEKMLYPVGDVRELAEPAVTAAAIGFFVVESGGEQVRLPYDSVTEFVEPPPWVAVPGAPSGFLGVAVLRGDALPMLSLAGLLGLPEAAPPATFAVIPLASGHRFLLGCGRVIGLRTGEDGRLLAPRDAVPDSLRRIVTGFEPPGTETNDTAGGSEAAAYLSFVVDQQLYAVSVDRVDRVVAPQRMVTLPRAAGQPNPAIGAIESRGQIVPVVQLRKQGEADPAPAGIYVILQGEAGPLALGADRAERVMTLRPEQIAAPPRDDDLIEGVAILDNGRDLLRILAAGRIGSER